MRLWRRRHLVALVHHHPAGKGEHRLAALIAPGRAHIDRAVLAVRVLLQPDDLGGGRERVAGIDGLEEAHIGVAEIGDGVPRDVRHRLAEHDVEHEHVVDRRGRIADALRKRVRRLHGEARAVKRGEQARIADGHGARRRVHDLLAELEILEEIAGAFVGHGWDFVVVHVGVASFRPMMEPISVTRKNSRSPWRALIKKMPAAPRPRTDAGPYRKGGSDRHSRAASASNKKLATRNEEDAVGKLGEALR